MRPRVPRLGSATSQGASARRPRGNYAKIARKQLLHFFQRNASSGRRQQQRTGSRRHTFSSLPACNGEVSRNTLPNLVVTLACRGRQQLASKPCNKMQETRKTPARTTQQHEKNTDCVWDLCPHMPQINCKNRGKQIVEQMKSCNLIHENPFSHVRKTWWQTHYHHKKKSTFQSVMTNTNVAVLACRGEKCLCLLGWNKCLTNRNAKVLPFHHIKNN